MATVPDHNAPEVHESEVKVFRQKYYIVDDEEDTGRLAAYPLHEARIEVLADDEGVFIESKEDGVTEHLAIPTKDLAVKVARYVLGVYGEQGESTALPLSCELQDCIAHELWRLSNHITSPHGPVDGQGAPELLRHVDKICELLQLAKKPHPKYSEGYKPNYNK